MLIDREALAAGRAARMLAELRRSCLDCRGCTGPCRALAEMAALPEAVLRRAGA